MSDDPSADVVFHDAPDFVQLHRPDPDEQRREIAEGLLAAPARCAPKYFYDALGSRLFEAITALDEYYPTRTEAAILDRHAAAIGQAVGAGATLVDLGAGNCAKAARLFDAWRPARYVAVDISVEFLRAALVRLQREHPRLPMTGVGLDFSAALALPRALVPGRRVLFYPGSSIGNFTPAEALAFLRSARECCAGGGLVIGVDMVKPVALLEAAYDDALGLTGAFNLNLLRHLNGLLGSDFDPRQWRHVAFYDTRHARVEMYLEARTPQRVRWPGTERSFAAGERIHTEHSHKYTAEGFAALLAEAGFGEQRCWMDEKRWFAVFWAAPR